MLTIKEYFSHPKILALTLLEHFGIWLPDRLYVPAIYRLLTGRKLNLRNPQTYNEKLQWLKIYDHRPEYTMMVDKYAVKEYVANIIGKEYVIPTLGVWDKPEYIEWNSLPNRFVLKTTHGGGNTGVIICKDKSKLDRNKTIAQLNASLKQDLYRNLREWPYKNVPRRIIAEQFIEGKNNDLPDYKFFCFNGEVKALFVGTERSSGDVKFDFFDSDFNHLDLVQSHPMSGKVIDKPICFEEMKKVASLLSTGIPHVRVDLYDNNGQVLFGEMTFYHHGGVEPFHPESWDYQFGSWLELPNNKR